MAPSPLSAIFREAFRERRGHPGEAQATIHGTPALRILVRPGSRPRTDVRTAEYSCPTVAAGAVFPFSDRAIEISGRIPDRDAVTNNCCPARALDVRPQPGCLAALARQRRIAMRPKKTILCVDQSEQALAVRKFMLEIRGYRVVTAVSGREALEVFRSGGIDLVLSDLLLPEMDGNEMVRRMKDISPEVPTILVSATVKNFERANRADAFLPKGGCTPGEVLERIRIMIARKRGPKKVVARPIPEPSPEAAFEGSLRPAIAS